MTSRGSKSSKSGFESHRPHLTGAPDDAERPEPWKLYVHASFTNGVLEGESPFSLKRLAEAGHVFSVAWLVDLVGIEPTTS